LGIFITACNGRSNQADPTPCSKCLTIQTASALINAPYRPPFPACLNVNRSSFTGYTKCDGLLTMTDRRPQLIQLTVTATADGKFSDRYTSQPTPNFDVKKCPKLSTYIGNIRSYCWTGIPNNESNRLLLFYLLIFIYQQLLLVKYTHF